MAQLFISHSSADNELALVVRQRLADLGYESVFLDVSDKDGLVPGTAWRDQLFANLNSCQALVLLGTPSSNASKWCHSEVSLALWLNKPVLALLVDGAPPHDLVADLQGLKITSSDVSADLLRKGLQALGLQQEEAWDPGRSPFPGLQPLDESYAPVFFGRERQVEELRQLVNSPGGSHRGTVVPVLGPSGSGKSSIVRAGLVAQLRRAKDWVVTDPFTPSDVPLAEVALALSHAAKRFDVSIGTDECARLLVTEGGLTQYVRRLRAESDLSDATQVLVVVDQAEELVTLTSEAERTAFFTALATAMREPSPLRVVMTARTDLWDLVVAEANRSGLAMAPTVLHVPPLSREDLARIITEPARRANLTLEPGLLERLLDDTGTGDALPLLAFTLSRLAAVAQDGVLTVAGYDVLGGVRGAIASRAAAVAKGARTEAEVAAAVLQLVGTGEGQVAARLARVDSVPAAQREILDDLVEARLVVVREQGEQPVYAPAHEALFSAWQPLADMLTHREGDLRRRARLERRTADWREGGSSSSGLLSGADLESAEEWQERSSDLVTPDTAAYIAASQKRQRRTRFLRIGTAAAFAGLVIILGVVLALKAADDRRQALEAQVAQLRAVAELEEATGGDPAAAAVAILKGLELDPGSEEFEDAAAGLVESPARDKILPPQGTPGLGLAVGTRVAVVASGLGPEAVDLRTGAVLGTVAPQGSAGLAVRPDDRVVVVNEATGLTWRDLTDASRAPLARSARSASQAVFSPDGTLMVSVQGNAVTLWNVATPGRPGEIDTWLADPSVVTAVAVTDDARVYTSGPTAMLLAWTPLTSAVSTTLVAEKPLPNVPVTHLWLDAERGTVLASRTGAGTSGVSVYDLATGDLDGEYVAAAGGPKDPLARLTATFGSTMSPVDGSVATFDLVGHGHVFPAGTPDDDDAFLSGHTAPVSLPAFTADGLLVSGSLDGSVRVWDVGGPADAPRGSAATIDALCDAFGARLDEDSIERALGDEDFTNPCDAGTERKDDSSLDLTTAAPSGIVDETVAVADDFSDALSVFPDKTIDVGNGATLERRVRGGRLHQTVTGGPARYFVPSGQFVLARKLPSAEARIAVSSPDRSSCGLSIADDAHRVYVTLDPVSGHGNIATWEGNTYVGEVQFEGGAAERGVTDRRLSLSVGEGQLAISVDGAVVDRRKVELTGVQDGGPASEAGNADCVYDDFSIAEP